MKHKLTPEQLANKFIKMLLKAGYTYEEMPAIFKLAKQKYKLLKQQKK